MMCALVTQTEAKAVRGCDKAIRNSFGGTIAGIPIDNAQQVRGSSISVP